LKVRRHFLSERVIDCWNILHQETRAHDLTLPSDVTLTANLAKNFTSIPRMLFFDMNWSVLFSKW